MKVTNLIRIFSVLLMLAFLIEGQLPGFHSLALVQKNESSLQETLDWLKEKLATYAIDTRTKKPKIKPVKFEGCTISYKVIDTETGKPISERTFKLADVITRQGVINGNVPGAGLAYVELELGTSGVRFNFADKEMAMRVLKAFSHAITLCKKKEPF